MRNPGRVVGLLDQVASSASNVAITIVAAKALDPSGFGGFAIAFAVYLFVLGGSRALATEPLLIRGASRTDSFRGASGAVVVLGLIAAGVCLVGGLCLRGVSGGAILALAPWLPFLLLQDACRYAAFAEERPVDALVVDIAWVTAQAAGMLWLALSRNTDSSQFMAVWSAAGSVGAIVGCVRARALPAVAAGARWLRSNVDLGGPFFAEFLAAGGASYAAIWLLGVVSGLPAVGAVRVGYTTFGPINLLYMGLYLTLVPQGARLAIERPRDTHRLMVRTSAVVVALTAAWTCGVVALPGGLGTTVFGDTWPLARPLLIPIGLATCAGGVAVGATAGLRALGAARASLRARLLTTPALVVLPLAGAALAEETGFVVGIAAGGWLTAGVWWKTFNRSLANVTRGTPDGKASTEPASGRVR